MIRPSLIIVNSFCEINSKSVASMFEYRPLLAYPTVGEVCMMKGDGGDEGGAKRGKSLK